MSKKQRKNTRPTVTILTINKVYTRGETSELTLAFAERERALEAIQLQLTNPEAVTTISIRTLGVISDA
jgi:hypothetical protein